LRAVDLPIKALWNFDLGGGVSPLVRLERTIMSVRIQLFSPLPATLPIIATLFFGSLVSRGQDSGVNLALHANSHTTAADIGLPAYPGATLYKDAHNDSGADLGLTVNDFHFGLLAVNYVTNDSAAQVLTFYRKHLSRYGEVLECDHGKPVGAMTVTRTGLTCGHVQVGDDTNSSTDHEIRAGSLHQYRIVGIDESHPGSTRFGLVYLDLPKDSAEKTN
jgi:hypothetical protein